jgi:hypothetical protein
MQELVLNRLRMPLHTRSASETGHRRSASPVSFEEKRGPPGLLGRPLRARPGQTPRRIRPLLAPTSLREDQRRGHHRLQGKQNPGHPESHGFRGRNPMAHTLACLRFAGLATETVARLTTGSGGLTLGRAGFAPAGRQTKFQGDIARPPPRSTSSAGSHCLTDPPGWLRTGWLRPLLRIHHRMAGAQSGLRLMLALDEAASGRPCGRDPYESAIPVGLGERKGAHAGVPGGGGGSPSVLRPGPADPRSLSDRPASGRSCNEAGFGDS